MSFDESSSKASIHVKNMQARFKECIDHMREDINKIEDPKCKAMFETSAEVLTGLVKAFQDYQEKKKKSGSDFN